MDYESMTIQQLLPISNTIAEELGGRTFTQWSRSKASLIEKLRDDEDMLLLYVLDGSYGFTVDKVAVDQELIDETDDLPDHGDWAEANANAQIQEVVEAANESGVLDESEPESVDDLEAAGEGAAPKKKGVLFGLHTNWVAAHRELIEGFGDRLTYEKWGKWFPKYRTEDAEVVREMLEVTKKELDSGIKGKERSETKENYERLIIASGKFTAA